LNATTGRSSRARRRRVRHLADHAHPAPPATPERCGWRVGDVRRLGELVDLQRADDCVSADAPYTSTGRSSSTTAAHVRDRRQVFSSSGSGPAPSAGVRRHGLFSATSCRPWSGWAHRL
jgi:hypothetical protein